MKMIEKEKEEEKKNETYLMTNYFFYPRISGNVKME